MRCRTGEMEKAKADMGMVEQWKREEAKKFCGWDFSYLKGRLVMERPPWDYMEMAKTLVRNSSSVLDMGTGGGEAFSSMAPFPKHTAATEGYRPNYLLAKKRLSPSGVRVVHFDASRKSQKMPFSDGEFGLVLNRHDAFDSREVFRLLRSSGVFLTQQVGGDNLTDLKKFFHAGKKSGWSLAAARAGLEDAGFKIMKSANWKGKMAFKDVGALVYYLKAVPWVVPGFGVETHIGYLEKLQAIVERRGELAFTQTRFLINARKM